MTNNISFRKTAPLAKLIAISMLAGWTTVSFVGCSKDEKPREEAPAPPEAREPVKSVEIPVIEAPAIDDAESLVPGKEDPAPTPSHNNPQTTISRPAYPLPNAPLSELGVEDMAIRAIQSDKPAEKIEIIRAMRDVNTEESVSNLLRILQSETDGRVRAEALQALSKSTVLEGKLAHETAHEVRRTMDADPSPEVLVNGTDLLSTVADPASVQYMKESFAAPNTDNVLKTVVAAKGLNRIHQANPEAVTAAEVDQYNTRLKEIYDANDTQVVRYQAVTALGAGKQIDYLKELMQKEQDPMMKSLISRTLIANGVEPGDIPLQTNTPPQP